MDGRRRRDLPKASGVDQRLRGAAPTGGADAHDSLRKVLGYVHADIVDVACKRVPLTRDAIGPEGTIADPQIREQITAALTALTQHVAHRDTEDPHA